MTRHNVSWWLFKITSKLTKNNNRQYAQGICNGRTSFTKRWNDYKKKFVLILSIKENLHCTIEGVVVFETLNTEQQQYQLLKLMMREYNVRETDTIFYKNIEAWDVTNIVHYIRIHNVHMNISLYFNLSSYWQGKG